MNQDEKIQYLDEILVNARNEYNQNGEGCSYDDYAYDAIHSYAMENGLKNDPEKIRGTRGKEKLDYPVSSLMKIKVKEGIDKFKKFLRENPGNYLITIKIDGTSIVLKYKAGTLQVLSTGDGNYGFDISHFCNYVYFPEYFGIDCVIRGEFTIKYEKFYEIQPLLKSRGLKAENPRNILNAQVNRVEIDPEVLSRCNFIAFDVMSWDTDLDTKFGFLSNHGFELPQPQIYYFDNNSPYFDEQAEEFWNYCINTRRELFDNCGYRIDGIVITSIPNSIAPPSIDPPKYSIAFKEDMAAVAVIKEIVWTVSRLGRLTPIFLLKEPVMINGSMFTKATADNAGRLIKENIGRGATILLRHSGDVTPNFDSKLFDGEKPTYPDVDCYWDENKTHLYVNNPENYPEYTIEKLVYFVKSIGVKNFGTETAEKFYNFGIRDIGSLIRARPEQLSCSITGMGDISSNKLVNQIRECLSKITYPVLMSSCGVFPEGIGKKTMELFIESFPDWEYRTITSEEIESVKGFGEIKSKDIADNLENFKIWLSNHQECIPTQQVIRYENQDLLGQTFVFTGVGEKTLGSFYDILIARGAKISSNFVQSATLIISANPSKLTNKLKNAAQNGIPIMSYDDFQRRFF